MPRYSAVGYQRSELGDPLVTSWKAFALVAIPVPLGQAFSYAIPDALLGQAVPGARVFCPFGRRQILGVILEVSHEPPSAFDPAKIKAIHALVGDDAAIPTELLEFLRRMSRYYLAPIGEVVRMALPVLDKESAKKAEKESGHQLAGSVGKMLKAILKRADLKPEQLGKIEKLRGQAAALWAELGDEPQVIRQLEERYSNARAAAKKLESLGLVEFCEVPELKDALHSSHFEFEAAPQLNEHQTAAGQAIEQSIEKDEAKAFLLHGVTGSGKTEVYLHAVDAARRLGKGAIILVPEIALTPQLVARFRGRFGDTIAVWHSEMTVSQRLDMWKRLRSGELDVVVGARSALFAPVQNLGLICVDEEHDPSFKQEEGVRYHARDMAWLRAHCAKATCVLGTATPSLESLVRSESESLQYLRLPERAKRQATLPEVEVIDLKSSGPGPSGDKLLSGKLYRELQQCLGRGEQAILFLNRRGFAPTLVCESCGTCVECPSCAVSLTYHRSPRERLLCHYCDYEVARVTQCKECGSPDLSIEGAGTEKIEDSLAQLFPEAKIGRLDRDTAGGTKTEALLKKMRDGELDILIGTQMVTKGHDLPMVTLVGVLNADAALSLPDFRAAERSFHLLVQVAGRAGRADRPGKVLIQTRDPKHPAIRFAMAHDVDGFLAAEKEARKELSYPPYSHLAMVRFDSLDETLAKRVASELAQVARQAAQLEAEILGPTAAPLAKLRLRYRFRFLVRAKDRNALKRTLLAVLRMRVDPKVRFHVDIDPMSML